MEEMTDEALSTELDNYMLEDETQDAPQEAQTEQTAQTEEKVQTEQEARTARLRGEVEDFMQAHPGVSVCDLERDPSFVKFAGDRLYRVPLQALYRDYVELMGDAQRAATEKAGRRTARSTGGGQGGGMDLLSPIQRIELAAWNRENPGLKMTPKEFLGR